jgi:hypothetical protein
VLVHYLQMLSYDCISKFKKRCICQPALQLIPLFRTQLIFALRLTVPGLLLVVSIACSGYKFEALCTGAWQHHAQSAALVILSTTILS